MLRGAPLIWRSSKQGSITLSTAEAELNELIEGLMMGESVSAIMEEMEPGIVKMMISDSQAAVNICLAEGGSWRTRHLRLRASHARQRFITDWVLQHKPGEEMVADIGTKALASNRLKALKEMISMVKIEDGKTEEEEDAEERSEKEKKISEVKGGKPEEIEKILRMVVLMAAVGGAKAQREELEDFRWMMVLVVWAGLMMVVGIWVTMRKIWEACRGVMGSGREREPEAEPEREVEEQREEIRRTRFPRSYTSTYQPGPYTGNPSPIQTGSRRSRRSRWCARKENPSSQRRME